MDAIVPSRSEWIRDLTQLDPALGAILFVVGLVFVLMGWRIFKVLIIVNSAALGMLVGAVVGGAIGKSWVWPVVLGLAVAVVFGLLALRVMRAGAVLCAALVGGYVGMIITSGFSDRPEVQLVGGGVALLVAASLAFVVFEHLMIAVLSFQGALLATTGALSAVSEQMGFLRHLREMANDHGFFVPFCVMALTVIGICVQLAGLREGGTRTKSE